jgi:hypothetical protein
VNRCKGCKAPLAFRQDRSEKHCAKCAKCAKPGKVLSRQAVRVLCTAEPDDSKQFLVCQGLDKPVMRDRKPVHWRLVARAKSWKIAMLCMHVLRRKGGGAIVLRDSPFLEFVRENV